MFSTSKSDACDGAQALVRAVADEVRRAGRADRVILGSLDNPAIWRMCGEALPEAARILPMRAVRCPLARPA